MMVDKPLDLDARYAVAREKSDHDDAWFVTLLVINELRATRIELDGNYNEMMTAYGIAEANLKRAERAEAAIARVEALCGRGFPIPYPNVEEDVVTAIRAALRGDQ